jgi:hypothetical protein
MEGYISEKDSMFLFACKTYLCRVIHRNAYLSLANSDTVIEDSFILDDILSVTQLSIGCRHGFRINFDDDSSRTFFPNPPTFGLCQSWIDALSRRSISVEDFKVLQNLGKGAYGSVYLAKNENLKNVTQ